MRFDVTAYQPGEGVVTLNLEAAASSEIPGLVKQRGLELIAAAPASGWQLSLCRERPFDLLLFSQELCALLDAGLSIIEAMDTLARKEKAAGRKSLLEQIIRSLREGKPFSEAVRGLPQHFPALYIALISASERTGDLASALGRFVAYQNQTDSVRKRVQATALYPLLLIGVGGLVILFLMTYVVPRFSHIYEDFGRNLPWMSRLLMEWGGLIDAHGLAVLSCTGLLAGFAFWKFRTRDGWSMIFKLISAHPAAAERVHLYTLSRFYRTLGMLQQGGIPILPALDMARELLGPDRQPALATALADIRAGQPLSSALERQGLAPPVASDLLKVGEKTGNSGDKMIRIADFYDDDVARWVDWFTRLFEPLLMLGIGCFIALIVVLLYLPIFELAGNVQ